MKNQTNENKTKANFQRRSFIKQSGALGLGLAVSPIITSCNSFEEKTAPVAIDIKQRDKDLFFIGIEEHCSTPEMQKINHMEFVNQFTKADLNNVEAGRIKDMDDAGLNMQILSCLTPGAQNLLGKEAVKYAQKWNNWLADVVAKQPKRYKAFATVPLTNPEEGAKELERSVKELGLLGSMTYGSIDGKYLDNKFFDPFLAKSEELGVPIYIHPAYATKQAMEVFYNDLGNDLVSKILSGSGYGWHQEVALQSLRMIASGVFDRFPKLQIIIGHMGEALPFYYWRFAGDLTAVTKDKLKKPIQQYLQDNFWITTSAFFRDELLQLALSTMGEDRIMFATDYPFVTAKSGTDWFRAVDLPRETKEKIAYKNAQKLLKITN